MPTITTPDAPLSTGTAAGVNGATVDENLINLERGHPRCQVSSCFPITHAVLVDRVDVQRPVPFI